MDRGVFAKGVVRAGKEDKVELDGEIAEASFRLASPRLT
jgi:hypothetical protein